MRKRGRISCCWFSLSRSLWSYQELNIYLFNAHCRHSTHRRGSRKSPGAKRSYMKWKCENEKVKKWRGKLLTLNQLGEKLNDSLSYFLIYIFNCHCCVVELHNFSFSFNFTTLWRTEDCRKWEQFENSIWKMGKGKKNENAYWNLDLNNNSMTTSFFSLSEQHEKVECLMLISWVIFGIIFLPKRAISSNCVNLKGKKKKWRFESISFFWVW